ncbi:MAG: hypothetical protein ACK4WF_09575, partial [Candidatus Brocadiales bacterium]
RFVMVEGRLLPWKKERPSVPREAQEAYKAFMKGLWQSPEGAPRILRFAPDAQELLPVNPALSQARRPYAPFEGFSGVN